MIAKSVAERGCAILSFEEALGWLGAAGPRGETAAGPMAGAEGISLHLQCLLLSVSAGLGLLPPPSLESRVVEHLPPSRKTAYPAFKGWWPERCVWLSFHLLELLLSRHIQGCCLYPSFFTCANYLGYQK